jgi:hypothetical protein
VRLYLKKNPSQKRVGGVAQDIGPQFQTPVPRKKKIKKYKTKHKTAN